MIHRLLCCSDTHGKVPPPLYETEATAWLHAGDVTDGPLIAAGRSSASLDRLRANLAGWFAERQLPIYLVKGNHDTVDPYNALQTASNVGGALRQLADDLYVAGVGWSGERFFELPLESDLARVCDDVSRQARLLLKNSDRVVLLTHYPPRFPGMREMERDVANGGVWYDCVRDLASDLRPIAIVQGHVHSWNGTSQTVDLGGSQTIVFHPGPAGGTLIIDTKSGSAEIEWPPVY